MKVETTCTIVARTLLSETALSLTLEVGDMVRKSYKAPGQFVHIKCGDGLLLRRPISVCSCQEDTPHDLLRIVFEDRGEGTAWLFQRQEGETLDVLGLLGNGFQLGQTGRYLLVGGGIGIPPMLGCAQSAPGRCKAILGFRSESRVMMLEEFRAAEAEVDFATDDGTAGYHGYVDALVRQELERDNSYAGVLCCGPKGMLRGIVQAAQRYNIPCQVSMEERMGCGVGACLVCACDMQDGTRKHVCKDGPVFDSREVDFDA